jgi:hypothetical protein
MTILIVQSISRSGVQPIYNTAAGGGDEFLNDGRTWIHVKNGAVVLNITLVSQITVDGLDVEDLVITVPINDERLIGIFSTEWYNDADGKVQIIYDDASNVTLAVLTY